MPDLNMYSRSLIGGKRRKSTKGDVLDGARGGIQAPATFGTIRKVARLDPERPWLVAGLNLAQAVGPIHCILQICPTPCRLCRFVCAEKITGLFRRLPRHPKRTRRVVGDVSDWAEPLSHSDRCKLGELRIGDD
jgi:hypothetical protein